MKVKRILTILLLFLTIFSVIQPVVVQAASGSSRYIGAQYASRYTTTESYNNGDGILIRRLTDTQTNQRWTVFCAQHGAEFQTGSAYNGTYYTPTDPIIKKGCQVAYFGWYEKYGEYVVDGGILDDSWAIDRRKEYVFTQQYIWEVTGQSNATFTNSDLQREYENYKNYINNKIDNIKKIPSFCNSTITVNAGETTTITDEYGVLADYSSINHTENGVTFVHNQGENTISVTVNNDCTLEDFRISNEMMKDWGLVKEATKDHDTTVYFQFENGQDQLYAFHYNDPVTMYMDLKINSFGRLELTKLDTNGKLLDGATYNVTGPDGFNKNVDVKDGKIVLEGLKKGTYIISEINAPSGYLLDTKSYNVEVKVNETASQAITNIEPTGTFSLVKKNATKDKNLQGAKYRIWNNNGYNEEFTTNNDGKIEVSGLKLGKYNYQETQAPEGYILDTKIYSFELKYKDQNTSIVYESVERVNTEPTGKILIYKVSENNDKVGGAVFKITAAEKITNKAGSKIYYNEGQEVARITTESKTGIAQIDKLPMGKYKVQEVSAPNGYLLNDKIYNADLVYKNDTTPVVELKIEGIKNNEPTGKIILYKVSENNDKIGGAVFKITAAEKITNKAGSKTYYNVGQEVARITTDSATGVAQIDKLPMGKYKVQEVSAPYGYLLNDKIYNADLVYKNDTTPIVELKIEGIRNTEPTGKIVLYKVSENNDKIGGVVFKITAAEKITNKAGSKTYYNEGQEVARITTDSKTGIAQIDKLPMGKYKVQEVSTVHGYLLNDKIYNADLVYKNDTTPVVELKIEGIKNDEPTGKIILYKVSENNDKVGGAVFKITAAEKITNKAGSKTYYNAGQEVARITTDSETGVAQIDKLPMGKYRVQEVSAPQGYLLNDKIYDVDLVYKDATTPVIEIKIKDITNNEPRGTIGISKRDSKTGYVPQGDAILKGAVYKVYANEDIYNVAKTKKFYSKGDLVATRTTNEKGICEDVTNLPLGKFIVREESAPIGYLIDKKEYEVNLVYKDQYTPIITGKVDSVDKVKEMRIHIYKSGIKVDSGKVPGLSGVQFTIKLNSDVQNAYNKGYTYEEVWDGIDEYGNKVKVNKNRVAEAQVIAPSYATIVTDENGDAYTNEVLPYGTYITKETETVKDYESAADFKFTISEDESEIKDIAKKVKDIVVNNEQIETYIKLIKKDKTTGRTVSLNSATFQIKATKDIYDRATGKIIYKKGEAVTQKIGSTIFNSFTTNSKNLVVPDNSYNNNKETLGTIVTPLKLEVGSYEITEIKIPEGFLQLEKPVTFKVEGIKDYDKDNEGDYIKEIEILNEQPTGTLIVDKSVALRENVDTSLVDVSDLSGIQFKLTAKENIVDMVDGSIIYKKGQEIKTYNLDKKGNLKIEKLPMGKYQLQEIKTLDGLVLNNTIYDVEFIKKDNTTKVYTETRKVVNNTTLVDISKTDITGEKELRGAKLSVIDEKGKVIDSWTSTENTHKIEGLQVNKKYILREELAPIGFVKSSEIEFIVKNEKEIQRVQMIDKIVEMSKVNIGGDEIEGAKIKVLDKDNNTIDEWTSSKIPHIINNLVEGETYVLHEEVAADGYVKATDISFTVTLDKETQHIEMIDKIVSMKKVDIAGNEIEGAEFKVIDKDGNIVDSWISTKEPHKIKGLKEGEKYTLYEDYAPDGFVISNEMEFTVSKDKETQEIKMIDKVVEISKQDFGGEELEGATLVVTNKRTKNIVDKWVSTKEPHKVNGLIEDETYVLHEEIAIDGYVKANDIEFTVTSDKETQNVVMIDKIVEIVKTDLTTGEELEGAELQVIDEDGNIVDSWISSKEAHIVKGLEENKNYKLVEKTAPYGYEITEEIEFTVTENKETQRIEMADKPILKTIQVLKADSETKESIKADFKFGIYEDENCTKLIKEVKSDKETGIASFEDLRYGIFFIKETKAPAGYQLSDKIIKVEINDKGILVDAEKVEENNSIAQFTYYNDKIPEIQTGNETNYGALAISCISSLLGIIIGIITLKRKKN